MRRDMQRGRSSQTRSKDEDRAIARGTFELVERGEGCRSEPFESRRSRAAAEPWIIHPPDFARAVIPHVRFGRDPAIGAIGIAIKSQEVDPRFTALLRQFGSRGPYFQFAVFKWNWFAHSGSGVDAVRRREQDQPVWEGCQGNHCEIQNRNRENDAPPE